MSIRISRIDPFDAAEVDAWWDAYASAERADRGEDAPVWTREEGRSELQQESSVVDRRAYLLLDGGTVVGSAGLALPRTDNTHVAHISISVPPAHRRRGVGSAALAYLEQEARSAGRTTAQATTSWAVDRGVDGSGAPGREFARRHGYALALGDVQSRLALPVDSAALDRLQDEATTAGVGYRVRSWTGPVPADLVEGWAALDASLETEAPMGDLDLAERTPDVAAIRESEELIARQRRLSFGAIALTTRGEAAAYSQLVLSTDDGNAYQWGTLVRAEDRGHRLGLAVKLATLRLLQHDAPRTRAVYTYNADSNTHMRAVNHRLGFHPSERMGELQKRLD